MEIFNLEKHKQGFWMFCAQCKGYAYTPTEARLHNVEMHGTTIEYAARWWPD